MNALSKNSCAAFSTRLRRRGRLLRATDIDHTIKKCMTHDEISFAWSGAEVESGYDHTRCAGLSLQPALRKNRLIKRVQLVLEMFDLDILAFPSSCEHCKLVLELPAPDIELASRHVEEAAGDRPYKRQDGARNCSDWPEVGWSLPPGLCESTDLEPQLFSRKAI